MGWVATLHCMQYGGNMLGGPAFHRTDVLLLQDTANAAAQKAALAAVAAGNNALYINRTDAEAAAAAKAAGTKVVDQVKAGTPISQIAINNSSPAPAGATLGLPGATTANISTGGQLYIAEDKSKNFIHTASCCLYDMTNGND